MVETLAAWLFYVGEPALFLWASEYMHSRREGMRNVVRWWPHVPVMGAIVFASWAIFSYRPAYVLIPWGAYLAWASYRRATDYAPIREPRLTRDNHETLP